MRQVAGAFAEYEKARLVAKLRAARDRKRAAGGRAEGRKGHAALRPRSFARPNARAEPARKTACAVAFGRSRKSWRGRGT